VKPDADDRLLVTGATGLVGSHVAERARGQGLAVRALCREGSDTRFLDSIGVEKAVGDMTDAASLARAVAGATVIIHCAAKVGDWGPVDDYRAANVVGLERLLEAAMSTGTLRRFIHVSSLGVYEARDHYGTDETEPPGDGGIDGYTATKIEAERLMGDWIARRDLPATILRPGFIYGPRDRTVLPRLLERLKSGRFVFLGRADRLVNNTYVANLVDAIFAALERDDSLGRVYNITDGRLVTKREFIATICEQAGYPVPRRAIPIRLARPLAKALEAVWRRRGKAEAPVLSSARVKFLGLNLDFSIDRARHELGYDPQIDFRDAMRATIDWFRAQGAV
jgi:nucleoside-diphosphate-sugar epimerase